MAGMADSAFVPGRVLRQVSQIYGSSEIASSLRGQRANVFSKNPTDIAVSCVQQAVIVATVCGVCGMLMVSRRRKPRNLHRSRITLGLKPTSADWEREAFRAKPGDKYHYRLSTDMTPEYGHWPPEAEGRVVRYGRVLSRGKSLGPEMFKKMLEDEELKKQAKGVSLDKDKEGAVGALLCDCDGTLVETERDGHRVAFNQAFKEKGYDCEWEVGLYGELLTTGGGKERMARYFKDYNPEAWAKLHEDKPAADHPAIVELHKLKTQLFMDIVKSGSLPLRDGVEELLSAADAAGWKLAVCSTSQEASVKAVVETYLSKFASKMRIFAGEVVTAKKPDPEIYELAAKELGMTPMNCVVVEDTNIGLQAGKAAGMQVIITKSIYTENEDFGEADLVVTSAAEIDFENDVKTMLPVLEEALA